MTMSASTMTIRATDFKARCLALLDRVQRTGESIIVTKRGRAVAELRPTRPAKVKSLRGSLTYHGDIVAPLDIKWNAQD
jgi:prevent-host-death family protein